MKQSIENKKSFYSELKIPVKLAELRDIIQKDSWQCFVPRFLTFLDVPLLSCCALLHISAKEWQSHFSFGNNMPVRAVEGGPRDLSPDLLGSPERE